MINPAKILTLLALLLCGCGKPAQPDAPKQTPQRIISLAPNITETIYALDLGKKLVGDTSYCNYPEAAQHIPKVGGFGQINYEAIVALHPDLVILHKEYEADKERLTALNIPYLETGSYFIADILETIRRIGTACGQPEPAEKLVAQLESRMEMIRTPTPTPTRPRVLILFGGDNLELIQAIGPACIHHELLEIAGGQNVIEGQFPFVTLSREAVIRLNPDIIIALTPGQPLPDDPTAIWKNLDTIHAVKAGRIHILNGDYTCIPGPRFIQTLEDFAAIIRPNYLGTE